jgi:hypothetical protein
MAALVLLDSSALLLLLPSIYSEKKSSVGVAAEAGIACPRLVMTSAKIASHDNHFTRIRQSFLL